MKAKDLQNKYPKLRKEDIDCINLATAEIEEVDYFVTRDKKNYFDTGVNKSFFNDTGIKIVFPETLVPTIYEHIEKHRSIKTKDLPTCIENIQKKNLADEKISIGERYLLTNYLRRCQGYTIDESCNLFAHRSDYNKLKTGFKLRGTDPVIWICDDIKNNLPGICPHSKTFDYCKDALPLTEDGKKDNEKEDIAKSKPSPFYFHINNFITK